MGPHPNLVSLALEQIQQTTQANMVNEKMVVGKIMELKGIQLQQGLTQDMSSNMTLEQYRRRMGLEKTTASEAASTKSQTEMLLEAAEKSLRDKGLDNMDPMKFQQAVKEHVTGRRSKTSPKAHVKKEPKDSKEHQKPTAATPADQGVLMVDSSDDELVKVSGAAGSAI